MACMTPNPPDLTPAAATVLDFFDSLKSEDDQYAFLGCMRRYCAAVTVEDQAEALSELKGWLESRGMIAKAEGGQE